jgi:hypothetical protein
LPVWEAEPPEWEVVVWAVNGASPPPPTFRFRLLKKSIGGRFGRHLGITRPTLHQKLRKYGTM